MDGNGKWRGGGVDGRWPRPPGPCGPPWGGGGGTAPWASSGTTGPGGGPAGAGPGQLLERAQEQRVHAGAQLRQDGRAGVGGSAEDPVERLDRGRRPDREAQAGDAVLPQLGQRPVGVGLGVGALVVVVVGEPV